MKTMNDIRMPKNQAVVDRLRRRFEKYRSRHEECIPRYDHTTNGHNDQHKQDTLLLRQRFLESKAKKSGKSKDKGNKHHHNNNNNNNSNNGASSSNAQQQQQDGNGNQGMGSMVGSSRLSKRPCEDADMGSSMGGGTSGENYEPPTKMAMGSINGRSLQNSSNLFSKSKSKSKNNSNSSSSNNEPSTSTSTGNANCSSSSSSSNSNNNGNNANLNSSTNSSSSSSSNLTKFSLEIVHQVELTSGNGNNSMPNVTVKTSTNTNVKTGGNGRGGGGGGGGNGIGGGGGGGLGGNGSSSSTNINNTPTSNNYNANNNSSSSSTNNHSTNHQLHSNRNSNTNQLSNSSSSTSNSLPSNTTTTSYTSSNTLNIELKQDSLLNSSSSGSAFADLDECAAALEKDAASSGGSSMIASLIGLNGEGGPELIPSDTLKDLISEISDLNPDFMGDFDFDDDRSMEMSTGISLLANSLNSSITPCTTPSSIGNTNAMMTNSFSLDNSNMGQSSMYGNNSNHCNQQQQQQHHGHHPVAPVTPTASSTNSSPRLGHMKMEADMSSTFSSLSSSIDSVCGNRGLSHCAGPSPAAGSTASPLASQLNSHHPSQTPPYCSTGSAHFDVMSPTSGVAQQPSHSGSSTPNSSYGPTPTRVPTPSSGSKVSGSGARIPFTSPSVHDSTAAQTLKQMAEQHQHKAQMGISNYSKSTPPNSNPSPARSPFNGDAYGNGFNNPGSVNSMGGGVGDYNNPSASPVFPNVRTPSSNESMMGGMNINVKQEANCNINYFNQQQQPGPPQPNFSQIDSGLNSGNMGKRNALSHQQQQHMLAQSHQQQHKMPCGPGMMPGNMMNPMCNPNTGRLPNPTNVNAQMMMHQQQLQHQQQQSPVHPTNNKSFNNSTTTSHIHGHLSSPPTHGLSGHLTNQSHLQHIMNNNSNNRSGGGAGASNNNMGVVGAGLNNPNMQQQHPPNYPPSVHHQQQQQHVYNSNPNGPPPQHPSVQMSQAQQMSISQSNSSLQASASSSQQMGMTNGAPNEIMKSVNPLTLQQQQNMYYRQSSPQHPNQQQQLQHHSSQASASNIPNVPSMNTNNNVMDPSSFMTNSNNNPISSGGPNNANGSNQQGQTINFTQQHLRMTTNISPGVNNPSISQVAGNSMVRNTSMMGVPNSNNNGNVQGGPTSLNSINPMGARMSMPNRMSTGQGGIVEMGVNPRASVEMQQRMMMRHMHMRGGPAMSAQQQQMAMVRANGPQQQMVDYNSEMMPGNNPGMMNQNPSQGMMMNRVNSNAAPAGSVRSMGPNANPQNMPAGGHRLSQQQQQQNSMYQQQMQQQHTMVPGGVGMPRNSMVQQQQQPNAINMPVRGRMSSMQHQNPNANNNIVPSVGGGGGPMGNPNSMNQGMSANVRENANSMAFMNAQQQQVQIGMSSVNNVPGGVSAQEWLSMQHQQHEQAGMNRNFSMQQQQAMRGNHGTNPGFRPGPGMTMQMSQQQHMMAQMSMGNNGTNPNSNASAVPNGPMNSNSFTQQQQQQHQQRINPNANTGLPNNINSNSNNVNNGSNANHFFTQQQQQQQSMKMSQAQMMCMTSSSSNYPHPPSSSSNNNNLKNSNNNNMTSSISGNGNGGTLIQPTNQLMHPSSVASSHHLTPQQQQQMMSHHSHPQNPHSNITGNHHIKSDSDFNFDLTDPSNSFEGDTDFLNSFDASSNYQNILDSL